MARVVQVCPDASQISAWADLCKAINSTRNAEEREIRLSACEAYIKALEEGGIRPAIFITEA